MNKNTAIHVNIALAGPLFGGSVVVVMANVALQCQDMKNMYLYAHKVVHLQL